METFMKYIKLIRNKRMNGEILPYMGGSDTLAAEPDCSGKGQAAVEASTDSNSDKNDESSDPILGRPFGAMEEGVRPFDLLGLRSVESPALNLIGDSHEVSHFVPPEKGPKSTTHLNPNPEFVKSLLEKIKEPMVLHLRGCDQLFLPAASPFPFEKFKLLTSLEISGVTNLTALPEKIVSQLTQLEALNLSHLPIQQLPTHFFSTLIHLRSLTLSDCPNIHSLPEIPQTAALEYLELSHLLIETLPEGSFSNLEKLKRLILRGCSKLHSLPSIQPLEKLLQVLDLSHCTALQEMEPIQFDNLWKLDFSYTVLRMTSPYVKLPITHLFLRDAKEINFEGFANLPKLRVLDVSGAQYVKGLDRFKDSQELAALDLSRIGIESIDFISGLVNLRYLILRECTRLQKLPTMEKLTQLEVIDISGCEILGDLPEDISSLKKLKELNLAGCSGLKELNPELFDEMTCLEKLDTSKTLTSLDTLDLTAPCTSGEIDFMSGMENVHTRHSRLEGRFSKPNEFYIVSTYSGNSGFDRFNKNFEVIGGLVIRFQENLKGVSSIEDDLPPPTPPAKIDADRSQIIKRECARMVADLRYIRDNIGLLESSHSRTSAEELLDELTDCRDLYPWCEYAFIPINPSIFHFRLNLTNFKQVVRAVTKLKLLVPPKQVGASEKKRKVNFMTRDIFGLERASLVDMNTPEMQALNRSYVSLTNIQKNCLKHFAVGFRFAVAYKEKLLIQLWYGEGFIDPQNEGNVNSEITSSTTNQVEEIGRQILMALEEKNFIERMSPWDRESKKWILKESPQYFLRPRAKPENLFVFQHKTRKLTTHFTGSHRACLLEFGNDFPTDINSSETPECYKTIRTLINVNAPNIYITPQWFSKMRNLSVLHLKGLDLANETEAVEVVDLKFLEELKYMKQLRLLSLDRFATMKKLPDSVCKVTNLKVLNLRDCSYLEELPAGIGSLKNLTHLDLTNCPILYKLPKGIGMLSNLEVLKGFVIYYHIGGRQHRNACTLRELLQLEKLRKLNLVVHTEGFPFPNSSDLHVFNRMKNLCSLKIIWQHNPTNLEQQHQDIVEQSAQRHHSSSSGWQRLKCWEHQKPQNETLTEELLRSNLKKLELRCFPFETTPEWLHPTGVQKLEKLYVRGGKLITLVGDANQNTWGVETLVFRYLPNMYMDWEVLRCSFPRIKYLEVHECGHLLNNPCNPRGVWTIEDDKYRVNWTRAIEDEE